jgi:hypothetical protein
MRLSQNLFMDEGMMTCPKISVYIWYDVKTVVGLRRALCCSFVAFWACYVNQPTSAAAEDAATPDAMSR